MILILSKLVQSAVTVFAHHRHHRKVCVCVCLRIDLQRLFTTQSESGQNRMAALEHCSPFNHRHLSSCTVSCTSSPPIIIILLSTLYSACWSTTLWSLVCSLMSLTVSFFSFSIILSIIAFCKWQQPKMCINRLYWVVSSIGCPCLTQTTWR